MILGRADVQTDAQKGINCHECGGNLPDIRESPYLAQCGIKDGDSRKDRQCYLFEDVINFITHLEHITSLSVILEVLHLSFKNGDPLDDVVVLVHLLL